MLNVRKRSDWDNSSVVDFTRAKKISAPVDEIYLEPLYISSSCESSVNVSLRLKT